MCRNYSLKKFLAYCQGERKERNNFVNNILLPHIRAVEAYAGKRPIFASIYGSQNYGLSTEKSDIDTKAIIFPDLKQIITNQGKVSKSLKTESGEICDVKDVASFVQLLLLQNLNCIENLFSKEYFCDEGWDFEISELFAMREDIAHIDANKIFRCAKGMAYSSLKSPNPKRICDVFRMRNFIEAYLSERPFSDCLVSFEVNSRDFLLSCKYGEIHKSELFPLARKQINEIEILIAEQKFREVNQAAIDNLNEWLYKASLKNITTQL